NVTSKPPSRPMQLKKTKKLPYTRWSRQTLQGAEEPTGFQTGSRETKARSLRRRRALSCPGHMDLSVSSARSSPQGQIPSRDPVRVLRVSSLPWPMEGAGVVFWQALKGALALLPECCTRFTQDVDKGDEEGPSHEKAAKVHTPFRLIDRPLPGGDRRRAGDGPGSSGSGCPPGERPTGCHAHHPRGGQATGPGEQQTAKPC